MSPAAIAEELGQRVKQARLNANFTQEDLVQKTGLSIKAILNAEKGRSQLQTLISILLALDMIEQLNLFIPPQEISPLQLAKLKGRKRQRASKSKRKSSNRKELSW
jgi:transcriptional regulator with XRE-family HTH domain